MSRSESRAADLGPGALAQLACIIEATARKPGNVHPGQAFEDASYVDFVLGAAAIAPALDRAGSRPLGETILEAVRATRRLAGTNVNLGIVLLLAPLAALGEVRARRAEPAARRRRRRDLRRDLRRLLGRLTARDAALAYEAIRLARPGGLGETPEGDVRGKPAGTLLEMMALARGRDLVARQYTNAYREVIEEGLPGLESALRAGNTLEEAVILCFLELLARHGDSLIARKRGAAESAEAARRARAVLRRGWPRGRGAAAALGALDRWLRARGHERNPGTTADLTAAVLYLALREECIPLPLRIGG